MSGELRRRGVDNWPLAIYGLILRIAVIAGAAYLVYRVRFIIVVVLISVMLALTMAPLVDWLRRSPLLRPLPTRHRRGAATLTVFILLGLLLLQATVSMVRPLAIEINQFTANWSYHQAQIMQRVAWLQEQYQALPPDIRQLVEEQGYRDLGQRLALQLQHLLHGTLESGMVLVELILIPVLAFSFLAEGRPLKREIANLIPRARVRDGMYIMRQSGIVLQSYAVGQLILALIAGIVVWLLLTGLGVRYALALAAIAAVTRVIPVIGPIIGGIPIVVMSSLQGWDRGLAVLIAFSLMHLVESKVVMPKIIGYRIKLHPAVVIIVLLIGAEFFGMWGMFLAAPVAAVAKTLLHHFLIRPKLRKPPSGPPPAPSVTQKEPELERPAIAGARSHSGAH